MYYSAEDSDAVGSPGAITCIGVEAVGSPGAITCIGVEAMGSRSSTRAITCVGKSDAVGSTRAITCVGKSEDVGSRSSPRAITPVPGSRSSTRASTPDPRSQSKAEVRSALDTLVRRRPEAKIKRKIVELPSSSEEEERDVVRPKKRRKHSIVNDVSFYARVNSEMDREKRRQSGFLVNTTMSLREAFFEFIKFYVLRLINGKGEFPLDDKKFARQLPILKASVDRIESSISNRKMLFAPSYWPRDSQLRDDLHKFPEYKTSHFRKYWRICDACEKNARVSATVTLRGRPYDSVSLWKGDIGKWLKSMRSGVDKDVDGPSMVHGDTCLDNVRIYHEMHHWKHKMFLSILVWIEERKLAGSDPHKAVKILESEKDETVEKWFDEYKKIKSLSEKNCEEISDPLGSR